MNSYAPWNINMHVDIIHSYAKCSQKKKGSDLFMASNGVSYYTSTMLRKTTPCFASGKKWVVWISFTRGYATSVTEIRLGGCSSAVCTQEWSKQKQWSSTRKRWNSELLVEQGFTVVALTLCKYRDIIKWAAWFWMASMGLAWHGFHITDAC